MQLAGESQFIILSRSRERKGRYGFQDRPKSIANFSAVTDRKKIEEFRQFVAYHFDELFEQDPALAPLLFKVLGIPQSTPLFESRSQRTWRLIRRIFMSQTSKISLAASALKHTRTEQGRYLVFDRLHADIVERAYDDEIGFLLRKVDGFQSLDQLKALWNQPNELTRAGYLLGLRHQSELLTHLSPLQCGINHQAILILVEEGVLSQPSDLRLLHQYVDHDTSRYTHDTIEEEKFRRTVLLLKNAQVVPEALVHLMSNPYNLNPWRLQYTLKHLFSSGITNISPIFVGLGSTLWDIETNVLQFVIHNMGVDQPDDLARLNRVLEYQRVPNAAVVRTLRELGAGPNELAACQELLVESAKMDNPPVERIKQLAAAPYNLSFADINRSVQYLRYGTGNDFTAFLVLLHRHGFGTAEGLNSFKNLFSSIRIEILEQLLQIASPCFGAMGTEKVEQWIRVAQYKQLDSIRYLADKVEINKPLQLNKLIDLGTISQDLLSYLYERRGLNTIEKLHRWYYEEGNGANNYKGAHAEGEAIIRVLFSDCSRRRNFVALSDSYGCIISAISAYAESQLGKFDYTWNEEQRQAYFARKTTLEIEARATLTSKLPDILAQTDGALLESLLLTALRGDDNLSALMHSLTPLIEDLLSGAGPSTPKITPLETDAVAMVYGVPTETVKRHWHAVCGLEFHLQSLVLQDAYPMSWRRVVRVAKKLEDPRVYEELMAHLDSLDTAVKFAQSWLDAQTTDRQTLISSLSNRALENPAVQAYKLPLYLGLLLVAASDYALVNPWIAHELSKVANDARDAQLAYAALTGLEGFFNVTLPDGLASGVNTFITSLADAEASALLVALSPKDANFPHLAAERREQLCSVMGDVQKKTLSLFIKWAKKEVAGFAEAETWDDPASTPMVAFVTKSPAAFFIKTSTGICTRDNTEMWHEERHCHLVVFDQHNKRAVGMAMLYFQPIPREFKGRQCLVMRAINLTKSAMSAFDAASVVESFMGAAIEIAQANHLACIALATESTYLSNQTELEGAIYASNYMHSAHKVGNARNTSSQGHWSQNAIFHAKAEGLSDGAVHTLNIVWKASD